MDKQTLSVLNYHSNTTLVKVKFFGTVCCKCFIFNSNTTLVKVKY